MKDRALKIFIGLSFGAALVYAILVFSASDTTPLATLRNTINHANISLRHLWGRRSTSNSVRNTKDFATNPSWGKPRHDTKQDHSSTHKTKVKEKGSHPGRTKTKGSKPSRNETQPGQKPERKIYLVSGSVATNGSSVHADRFTNASKTNHTQKYLIFVCDERRSCGGWGDRQRGLTGMYALALVTDRKFGIILTVPCNVTNFFLPNDVNWIIPDSELKGRSSISIDDVNSKKQITAKLWTMDFNAEYPQDVVYIRTNAEYWRSIRKSKRYASKLPAWARGSRAAFFSGAWRRLMKPRKSLESRMNAFFERIDFKNRKHPLVCSHVRVGRSSTIKTDTVVRCNISDLPVLWNFVDRWVRNGSHVFLATDNMQVRNLTRQRFGDMMYDSGGSIIHVDQQSDLPHACQGFESALLDQLILTRCDVLITSHSIFSQRASYLRGRSEDLYSFMHGKIRKSTLP